MQGYGFKKMKSQTIFPFFENHNCASRGGKYVLLVEAKIFFFEKQICVLLMKAQLCLSTCRGSKYVPPVKAYFCLKHNYT